MKIITNTQYIQRNKRIGQIATIASLVILGIGLYASFQNELVSWSFAALIVGFLLSQIGIFYISRWGRSPRPDQKLNQSLKGLDDKYTLYHYETPAPHLLIGPAGLFIIIPAQQPGTITYDEKKQRWKQKGGNLYMKIFAQESLGRPDLEIRSAKKDLMKFFDKRIENIEFPEPEPILLFTNEKATIQAENAPIPTLSASKLKDFVRRQARENPISMDVVEDIRTHLPKEKKSESEKEE